MNPSLKEDVYLAGAKIINKYKSMPGHMLGKLQSAAGAKFRTEKGKQPQTAETWNFTGSRSSIQE